MKSLSSPQIRQAVSVIKHGGILVYPTDTLYGLGGDATRKSVVAKIYQIKKRDRGKPLSVIVANLAMIKKYCHVDREQERILRPYLPGPYTFLLRLRKKLPVTKTKKIGVRIPDYAPIVRLCRLAGVPIITTSANISGKKDARRLSEVRPTIRRLVDLVLDGGKTKYGRGSTVVDLVDNKIVRKGAGRFETKDLFLVSTPP